MPIARAHSFALVGVHGHDVEIEADIQNGLPGLLLVGLPDTALREARDRIRAAITNSGEQWPLRRITVGLSPASLPKRGSGFDLGIAVAILSAAGSVPADAIDGVAFLGELGLDGQLRPVRGVLPAVAAAAASGFRRVAVPRANADEAALVPGLEVLGAGTLGALIGWLRDGPAAGAAGPVQVIEGGTAPGGEQARQPAAAGPALDLADVLGQPAARRAAEICAAGGHHLCLLGPPGAGKTMLAERIPTVLPRLGAAAALEVTSIHSVAGVLPDGRPLLTAPPFCAPHHTASKAAIVGGGSGVIRPGAASLAHRGCLFLDEAPEFGRDVLDALRQPLESGEVVVARSGLTARFPARFTLILAANPCPCARGPGQRAACECTPAVRRRYLARLSGPLLDRVDLRARMLPITTLAAVAEPWESTAQVRSRVIGARAAAAARWAGHGWATNAEVPGPVLRTRFALPAGVVRPLDSALRAGEITARGADRALRVAWTLADLSGRDRPDRELVETALFFRDRRVA